MADYYDSIASGYNELHGEEQRKKYRIIADKLQLPEHASVLDVGCGSGLGFDIIPSFGIDPSSELVKQHPNAIVGSAEALPFPDKSFDAAICVTAIHHTDYRKAIAEMQRVSRGHIAISVLAKSPKAQDIIAYCSATLRPLSIVKEEKDVILIHKPQSIKTQV